VKRRLAQESSRVSPRDTTGAKEYPEEERGSDVAFNLLRTEQKLEVTQLEGKLNLALGSLRDDLRKELHDAKQSMQRWCIGTIVTVLITAVVGFVVFYFSAIK
jgi:hypothetical protein